jgi:hypothetical protein
MCSGNAGRCVCVMNAGGQWCERENRRVQVKRESEEAGAKRGSVGWKRMCSTAMALRAGRGVCVCDQARVCRDDSMGDGLRLHCCWNDHDYFVTAAKLD